MQSCFRYDVATHTHYERIFVSCMKKNGLVIAKLENYWTNSDGMFTDVLLATSRMSIGRISFHCLVTVLSAEWNPTTTTIVATVLFAKTNRMPFTVLSFVSTICQEWKYFCTLSNEVATQQILTTRNNEQFRCLVRVWGILLGFLESVQSGMSIRWLRKVPGENSPSQPARPCKPVRSNRKCIYNFLWSVNFCDHETWSDDFSHGQ